MQRRKLFAVAVAGVLATGGLAACSGNSPNANNGNGSGARNYLTIGQPNGTQTKNFNPYTPNSAIQSLGFKFMIYEPIQMWNPVKPADPPKPWLATDVKWAPDYKKVDITVRDNATWNDGQKLTADDVAFTYNLIKKTESFNTSKTPYGDISVNGNVVTVTFTGSMFVYRNSWVSNTVILPKHVWESKTDPAKDINDNPVGSGPYTLKSFTPQTTTLSVRTSGYWQGLPQVKELRYTGYNDNNAQTTALSTGECEWSYVFIPNYKTVYVDKDPAHYKVWSPGNLGIHGLWINTTKAPFDDPKLRQALNMVINRNDIFVKAEAEYFHPLVTSITGIPAAGEAFIAPDYKGKNQEVDVEGAKKLLADAGYKLNGSVLSDPKGKPVKMTLTDPAGWSDYQTSLEIVKDNVAQIGIQATVDKANQDAWTKNIREGNFEAAFRWTDGGSTPYDMYRSILDGGFLAKIGTGADGNFGRFKSDEATAALKTYRDAADDAARTEAMNKIQKIFVDNMPMIPVGSGNVGMAYSTKYWTGWPDDGNPYGAGQPTQPNSLDVILHLEPANS